MDISESKLVDTKRINRHPWEIARKHVVLKMLRELLKGSTHITGTILDIGCGDAYVTTCIAMEYPMRQVIGIDNQFVSDRNNKLNYSNLQRYRCVEDAGLGKGSVCVVLMLDVLEHIADDAMFLKEMVNNEVIRKDAIFILTVPALKSLFSIHDHFLNHYRRYSIKRLTTIAQDAGIKLINRGYLFRVLLPIRLFKLCFEKNGYNTLTHSFEVFSWKGGKLLTGVIVKLLLMDFNLFKSNKKMK